MFRSKEQKEETRARNEERERREAELSQQLAETERNLNNLKRRFQARQEELGQAIEAYKQEMAGKWEYLQVSDKNIGTWGSLDRLGSMGWELVGIATYTEKVTNWNVVEGTIFTMYVFKRPAPTLPDSLLAKFADIPDIESQMHHAKVQLANVQQQQKQLEQSDL